MRIGPIVFNEDVVLNEPISSYGPITARGNLTSYSSVKANGPLSVNGNLEINSILKINGPMTVKGTMVCEKDAMAKVNGPTIIKKGIIGGVVRVNGPISSQYIEVTSLSVNGPVEVDEDIIAEKQIVFGISYSHKVQFEIGGIIEAPLIHIKNNSSKYSVSRIIRKIIGIDPKYNQILVLEDLKIRTKLLRLEGVELDDSCDVQAEKIEHVDIE